MPGALFTDPIVPVFFVYGLAFFSMGLVVGFESNAHLADREMRRTLLSLAAFALIHGLHEWFEMFFIIASSVGLAHPTPELEAARLVALTASFLALCLFGYQVIHLRRPFARHWPLLVVPLMVAVGGGLWIAARLLPDVDTTLHALDAWARYSLGVPGAMMAGIGLLRRAHDYREAGPVGVFRGWLVAGIGLTLYGLIGQTAPAPSVLFPSNLYNTDVFLTVFGFPVQLFRAAVAVVSTLGLMMALRGLEVERQRAMFAAQNARLAAQEQAHEEMTRRESLQKELLRRAVAAQEDERAHIARELHDRTGQTLTALNYRVAGLEAAVGAGTLPALDDVRDVRQLAEEALGDLRQLVTDLRPAQLDDLGLVAALTWLADQAHKRLRLEVRVDIVGHKRRLRRRLPGEIETALFRIAQEALTNVSRHAGVTDASLQLAFDDDCVEMVIRDEGQGFDTTPEQNGSAYGRARWGLIGMQERASSVGGEFHIQSAPGKGCTVWVLIPLTWEEHYGGRKENTAAAGR